MYLTYTPIPLYRNVNLALGLFLDLSLGRLIMKISNHDEQWNNNLVVAFFRSSWALQKWHSRVIIEEANDMKYGLSQFQHKI